MEQGIIQRFIEWVIHHGGLYVLLAIIFAETGLFLGFFLPGDSLLFAAGIYANELGNNFHHVHYTIIILMAIIASFTGSIVGYWFGLTTGSKMFQWKDRFFFKKKYLEKARVFYERYGRGTVFLSKFVPLIRTFAPILAGIVKMPKSTFLIFNIAGSVCWVSAMMFGGYFLQTWFQNKFNYSLKDHIELITIIIVLITTLPVIYKLVFGKKPAIAK